MLSLVFGTLALAATHALIPNHWLPLVAVARAERWKQPELISVSFIAALAHVLGTVVLGIIFGFIGDKLAEDFGRIIYAVTSILLIVFGLIYFTVNHPHQHHSETKDVEEYKRSKRKWIFIFIIMMFLSPCLEVESLFLSAGAYGMSLVLIMALIYSLISIAGIVFLVSLGYKGASLLPTEFIEHNEKRISGMILILVGIVTFFL
ncbi:MAG: accessory gene regulator B family protein, partial [Chitinophagaceae bacterium]|nr:accessory gene regulator B family protein [Chitinophagaceae bacterium]